MVLYSKVTDQYFSLYEHRLEVTWASSFNSALVPNKNTEAHLQVQLSLDIFVADQYTRV